MIIFSYIKTIIGIGFLIFIHELGHFLFCKIFKIPVAAFKIGRGKEFFSKIHNNTKYSIGMLPLGGYVAVGEENKPDEEVSILTKKPFYQGILVLLGGVLNNIIFMYLVVLFSTLFYSKEISQTPIKIFIHQEKITLNNNDKEKEEFAYNTVYDLIKASETNSSKLSLYDSKEKKIIKFEEINTNYHIDYNAFHYGKNIKNKFYYALKTGNNIIYINAINLFSSFTSGNFKNLSGPIGIFKTCSTAAEKGFLVFLSLLALISVSLAILNLLPIPIVDGGQLLLLIVNKIYGKEIPHKLQLIFTYGSFFLLGIITLYSTYNDIIKLIFN